MNDQIQREVRSRRPQRPPPLASPYVAGVPVHGNDFFGRKDVLDKIDKSLRQMGTNGVVLFGARRTGKTSVLHKIRDGDLGSGFVCAYVDMQAFAGASVDTFVTGFLRIIGEVILEQ